MGKGFEWTFLQRRYSNVQYHSKPIRIAIIKKNNNEYWLKSKEIRTLLLVGMQNDTYTFEKSSSSWNVKHRVTNWSSNSTLGIYPG